MQKFEQNNPDRDNLSITNYFQTSEYANCEKKNNKTEKSEKSKILVSIMKDCNECFLNLI